MSRELKIRYSSFDQFFRLNRESFQKIQNARSQLKSPEELGLTGNALLEAEKMCFYFLNLRNLVSDLLFSVVASVGDAKHNIKSQTGIAFRDLTGPQGDKNKYVEMDERVISAHKTFNDLYDLKEYLENKWKDFDSNHYYYKGLARND